MAINYSLSARPSIPADKNSEKKIYAISQYNEIVELKDLASHLASHGSPFSKGTIMGLLTDTMTCIRENLLLGNKIQLGDMGSFYVTLSCVGADSTEEFNTSLIKGVNVRWAPSDELSALLNEASFRQVATREIQLQGRKDMREAADNEVKGGNSSSESGGNAGGGNDDSGDPGDVTG